MLPEIGTTIDEKYVIEGELRQGGMAVVFAAHHAVLDRPVALKVFSPDLPRTPQLVQRFLVEARAVARIDSAYVARVFDAGTLEDGLPFIVMELLEGSDLDDVLSAYKRLSVGDAVDYVLQALQGLAHAHVLGVIHCDLKPANLFLARQSDGTSLIKVLDFGIAKLVDEARLARGETTSGCGSPMYMSPEQVRDAEHVDPRADIWSIGVVLYELLTGSTPFDADGIGGTFAAVLNETPASSRTLRPEIPAELDAAILRCLRQAPDERFADLAELAAAIAPFGTGACTALVESIEHTLRHEARRLTGTSIVPRPPPRSVRDLAPMRLAFSDEPEEALAYLYGDGTPSSLHTNFFTFLEDALDCVVQVLAHDDTILQGREDRERLPRETAAEIERLAGIVTATNDAITQAAKGPPGSPSAHVASAVLAHLKSRVPEEVTALKAKLAASMQAIPANESAARDGCAKAFEALLLRHDLPGASLSFALRRTDKDRYTAQVTGVVDYGMRWGLELEIPSGHTLARVVKLDKLASRIEVEAPELTGWLRKEIKLRGQRLDRHYVTELTIGTTSMSMKLRVASDGEGDGYDVEVDLPTSRAELTQHQRATTTSEAPYLLSEADTTKLAEVHKKLLAVARELAPCRRRLLKATIDDSPLWKEHDPSVVVERMVAIIAAIAREIAVRSPSATELALKRLTADNRREEVFVSKSSLLQKLATVPERLRPVVGPLVLVLESTGVRGSAPSHPRVA